tara:strand:- start:361 stop:711 length:351 start_codon:yes stop_codon:yes gene_type:complete
MTVKLSLLKSGEDVIADIQEMILDDKVVGYFFVNPCVVKVLAKDTGTQGKTPCQLQLTPWLPLTDEKKIPVAPDWVITIVEPMAQLKKMYEDGVLKDGGQDDQSVSTDDDTTIDDQ